MITETVTTVGSLLTSVGLCGDFVRVEVSDEAVIKLVPLVRAVLFQSQNFLLLNVRIVVATVGRASVHDNTDQVVLVVLGWLAHFDLLRQLFIFIISFILLSFFGVLILFLFLVEVLLGVLMQVDLHLEFEVIVQLLSNHEIKVEIEALEGRDQISWAVLDARAFQRINLLVTLFAVVLIVLIQEVTRNEGLHALIEILLVLDWDSKREEVF